MSILTRIYLGLAFLSFAAACEPERLVLAIEDLPLDAAAEALGDAAGEQGGGAGGSDATSSGAGGRSTNEEGGSSPAQGGSTRAHPRTMACRQNVDCDDQGSYCAYTSCGASTGTCVVRPAWCDPFVQPVCGCDRFTYLNDCLRQMNGTRAASDGECAPADAVDCGGQSQSCPDGSRCVKLSFAQDCSRMAEPHCWVVPTACDPSAAGSIRWSACSPIGGGGGIGAQGRCVDTCTAMALGGQFVRDSSCP